MPKKFALVLAASVFCFAAAFAQTDSIRVRKVDHFVGLQINELIRQIFNFDDNNNSVIDNPYLLRYSFFFAKKKWGVHTGIGYRFNSLATKEANNETKVSQLFYRVGMMRNP